MLSISETAKINHDLTKIFHYKMKSIKHYKKIHEFDHINNIEFLNLYD